MRPPATEAASTAGPRRASRWWLWIVALVALQLSAWIAWLVIAAQHRVAEVPLASHQGK